MQRYSRASQAYRPKAACSHNFRCPSKIPERNTCFISPHYCGNEHASNSFKPLDDCTAPSEYCQVFSKLL